MRNRRKNGVSRTTTYVKSTVRDKIFSNSSTGNKDYRKLSQVALANLKKIREFRKKKSKFVRADEFAGKGKTIEILEIEDDVKGKFGDTIQVKLREAETNAERIWSISGIRATNALLPLVERGIKRIHVWTTGTGTNTMYYAKEAGAKQNEKEIEVTEKKRKAGRSRR
jgi:hypothetical protein